MGSDALHSAPEFTPSLQVNPMSTSSAATVPTSNPLTHAATTAWGILTTREAIRWYKDTTKSFLAECFLCFCEGLLVLMAGTLRAGQILRELIHAGYQVILEMNAPVPVLALPSGNAPLALLPAVAMPHPDRDRAFRRSIKAAWQQSAEWGHSLEGLSVLVTPAIVSAAPAPKRRKGGRKPKAA